MEYLVWLTFLSLLLNVSKPKVIGAFANMLELQKVGRGLSKSLLLFDATSSTKHSKTSSQAIDDGVIPASRKRKAVTTTASAATSDAGTSTPTKIQTAQLFGGEIFVETAPD